MSQPVDQHIRADLLAWASGITTDSRDPVAIVLNASVLLGWLEESSSPGDLEARHAALGQHYRNQAVIALEDGETALWSDNPAALINGAKVLCAFLTSAPGIAHITEAAWDDFLTDTRDYPPERHGS